MFRLNRRRAATTLHWRISNIQLLSRHVSRRSVLLWPAGKINISLRGISLRGTNRFELQVDRPSKQTRRKNNQRQ
jgi:hypothetical protein